jgi:hypothetical protein
MPTRDPKLTEFSSEMLELAPRLDPQARALVLQLACDLVRFTADPNFNESDERVPERRLH